MPPRKTRYSSCLAADWVVPTPVIDEAIKLSREDVSGSSSTLSKPTSIVKPSRYKKVLPIEWVDAKADSKERDDLSLQPQINGELVDFEPLVTSKFERRENSFRNTHFIDTSIPKNGNCGYSPPPAPKFPPGGTAYQDWFFKHLPREPTHRRKRSTQSLRGSDERLQDWPEGKQLHSQPHGALYEESDHYNATISPPISTGQLSSAPTTSPFHGRDLPAKCPAISPSYSVV